MGMEIFLKISGVDGESKAHGHEDEIDVHSFSLGASNPSSVGTGAGSGAGKVDISSLSIQKEVDLASAKLFQKCCDGTHFDEATLCVREAGGESPLEYYVVKMKQVFIDSVNWGGAAAGPKPGESLTISFAEIQIDYTAQTETGAAGKTGQGSWNLKTNKAA